MATLTSTAVTALATVLLLWLPAAGAEQPEAPWLPAGCGVAGCSGAASRPALSVAGARPPRRSAGQASQHLRPRPGRDSEAVMGASQATLRGPCCCCRQGRRALAGWPGWREGGRGERVKKEAAGDQASTAAA